MSCLGLLVHAVRRTLPVLPYVCPHTSLVPLSHCLWGAGHCTGMDPWDSAGPSLPHPQAFEHFWTMEKLQAGPTDIFYTPTLWGASQQETVL